MNIVRQRSAHSDRLERWLGAAEVERISTAMRGAEPGWRWYGPPIGVGSTPGKVYATSDGDFVGPVRAGGLCSLLDYQVHRVTRAYKRWERRQPAVANAGFASLSDLIAEATGGKSRNFSFQKVGTTGVVNATNSLWAVGNLPSAGGNGSAAAAGRAPDDSTTGAFPFTNPASGDTQHFVSGFPVASVAANTLLLYDRIYDVAKTMASTANESVTGVPTRYQSSTPGDADYAAGNFLFIECTTVLANTAHNWGVAGSSNECLYRNQAGTDNQIMPVLAGNAANIVNRLDQPTGQWFAPLAAGDTGIMDLAQMRCSASVATGAINFVIGHPLAWLPCPVANMVCVADGINSAFALTRIFDDACLAFLEVLKPATTATTYAGTFKTVAG